MVLTEEQRKEFKEATAPLFGVYEKALAPTYKRDSNPGRSGTIGRRLFAEGRKKSRLICANQEQISK